jgi:hypothetical protein
VLLDRAGITPPKKERHFITHNQNNVRRNPGRMDGVTWNGSSFICNKSVDGETTLSEAINDSDFDSEFNSDDYDWDNNEYFAQESRHTRAVGCVLDMA